jgi:hypothetical protein
MKIILNTLILAAAVGIGLTLGFALRAKHVAAAATSAAPSPLPSSAAPRTNSFRGFGQRPGFRVNDDSPLATQLEYDLSKSSGVTRWLYWMEALEQAAPADFPRLARLAQGNPTALKFVAARWVEIAPRHLFDTTVAAIRSGRGFPDYDLMSVLYREWPRQDPDAAIAAFNEPGALVLGERDWRFQVAYTLLEKDIERGLRLMADGRLGDTGFGPSGLAAVTKWTRSNPQHAAEFMLEQLPSYTFRSAMEAVGQEWAKIDPSSAMSFAVGQPGELAATLSVVVLKEWAARDLNAVARWLTDADPRTRQRLSPTFVEVWARKDAAGALAWCQENLTGSSQARAVGGVLAGAAEKDPVEAGQLVSAMDPSPARAEAAVALALKWFPGSTLETSHQPASPDAVAWLNSLDGDTLKRVLEQLAWRWGTADPKSMAAFLAGVSTEQVSAHAYSVVARELARRDPAEALNWAGRLPAEQSLTAGGDAFAEWRIAQPEAAMSWLNELPAADPRRQAYFQGAVRSLAYHPQAAEQLAAMSMAERAVARGVIETMPLAEDRRARLLDLLKAR